MSDLQSFRVFLNQRLAAAAMEIFGAVEQTVKIYYEENQQLRTLLRITPEVKLPNRDSLQIPVSEEEVLLEQQHCEREWSPSEQEWSPSLGQEDPEPTQFKEEQEELWISQEEEQLQGLEEDNVGVLSKPPCVKSECDQENPIEPLALAQTQTVENRLHDPKKVHLSPSVTYKIPCNHPGYQYADFGHRSAVSIDAVGLDRCLPLDPRPPLDQNPAINKDCFKSTSRTFRCDDCGKKFIRKQHLATHILTHTDSLHLSLSFSQGEVPPEQLYCEQEGSPSLGLEDPVQPLALLQTQNLENSESDFEKVNRTPAVTLTHVTELVTPHDPSVNHNADYQLSLAVSSDPKPSLRKHCHKQNNGSCGKIFKLKGDLTKHPRNHTGEKHFGCGDCGKAFKLKGNLTKHIQIHTGEKAHTCSDCGKQFQQKGNLMKHLKIHTGEKLFKCNTCSKSFCQKSNLRRHILSHTGEKPFTCGDCWKSFSRKLNLNKHMETHRT